MMVAAWNEPDAQEALRRENWLNERGAGFVVPSFNGLGSAFKSMFVKDKHPEFTHTNTAEIGKAEKITVTEASWLVDRLNRDGHLSANEKALLQFLAEESPDLHESLIPYVNAA